MSIFSMGHFSHLNSELIRKMWQYIDVVAMVKGTAENAEKAAKDAKDAKDAKNKVISIIHEPVWEQARAFQETYESYMRQSASMHKIPFELLSAIIFNEMTYNFTSLEFDDFASKVRGLSPFRDSISTGPGQLHISHLKRWGYKGNKFELAQRLHTDMHFAIDASARLLNELVTEYQRRKAEKAAHEQRIGQYLGNTQKFLETSFDLTGWNEYIQVKQVQLDTENIEREAWPTIGEWYNAGEYKQNTKYRNKFINSLNALGY